MRAGSEVQDMRVIHKTQSFLCMRNEQVAF